MSKDSEKIKWGLDNNLDPNSVRINLEIPEEIFFEVQKHAKETWNSISNVLAKGLWTYIKDKFIEEERRKEVWHIIWDLTIEELENEVLNFMNTSPTEFAFWTEAKIYKMHIPWKDEDVLVVKRKYRWTSLEEFDIHTKAKEIEFLLKREWVENSVHIPSLFHHFNKDWEEYILMEFIEWKTLYLMIIESILENQTIKYWEKINDLDTQKEFYYIFYNILKEKKLWDLSLSDFNKLELSDIYELLSDEEWFLKEIDIETDIDWENILKYLYWILNEQWVLNIKVDSTMDMWWLEINKFLFDIVNNNNFSELPIFSTLEWLHLSKNISKFLSFMHKNWLYHRDLWSNTRNIILYKTEDWLYIANIIDFWKSKIFDSIVDNMEAYREENADGSFTRYVNDEMIVTKYIEKLSGEKKQRYRLVDKQKEIILNDLLEIWEKYWVKPNDIKLSFNFISRYKNIVYFDRLKDILLKREVVWWYKLNLSKTKKADLVKEREDDKSRVLADIITLMYFSKDENFNKIMSFIWNLKSDDDFNPPLKDKYIDLYSKIFIDVSKKRKK